MPWMFDTDNLKLLLKRPFLIISLLFPVLLVIVLNLFYPLIIIPLKSIFRTAPENWFTLTLITVISSIPIITGSILASVYLREDNLSHGYRNNIRSIVNRSLTSFFITFSLVVLSSVIADPVPSEGWLRTVYVSVLFSLVSVYVIIALNRREKMVKHLNFYILSLFFLICVPFGLLTSTPWHYIAFMSPLYWINWAWIFPNRTESILSGLFATLLLGGALSPLILILYRKKGN
jgi:hypothetical protein